MAYPLAASLKGYATSWLTNRFFAKPNNGFVSGNMNYAAGSPTATILTLTFSAAPADLSSLNFPDTPTIRPGNPLYAFTFTYSGAPGAHIIPLVAGGGTANQAATATQVALAAQLTNWTVTNPVAGQVKMVARQRGLTLTAAQLAAIRVGVTNVTIVQTAPSFGLIIPGRFGRNYCILPA